MTAHTPGVVFDCPCCGQGGLEVVRVRSNPPMEAVVCAECDRIWRSPRAVGIHNDEQLEAVLVEVGIEPSWVSLDRISKGVAWEGIDAEYQRFLRTRQTA